MELIEKTVKEEYIYKGRIINLRKDEVELPTGKIASREVVEHPGGVCVLPLTDKNEIIMERQYRRPYDEIVLEIPAGKREGKDEEPIECGKRELREETGAVAEKYTDLGELYPSPGYCAEVIYMFLAEGLTLGSDERDEDEFLNIEYVPFEKALKMVLSGEIKDAKTQAAIMKTAILKKFTI